MSTVADKMVSTLKLDKMVSTLKLAESLKLASQLEFGRVPLFVETYCNEARKALEVDLSEAAWLKVVSDAQDYMAQVDRDENENADAEEERARQFPQDEDERLDDNRRW